MILKSYFLLQFNIRIAIHKQRIGDGSIYVQIFMPPILRRGILLLGCLSLYSSVVVLILVARYLEKCLS